MIFEPADISTIRLRNRIIRSATHEGLVDDKGYPTEKLLNLYKILAKNEVGCIITGYAGVMQNGKTNYHHMLMIDDDSFIDPYRKITEKLHEYQTPVILQIAHCGRQTRSASTGFPTVAPSAIRDKVFREEIPHVLTESEIEETIGHFVQAVLRAKRAGFDGVQLHLAHGYLLAQFLSSYSNKRSDQWGGSLENRFRIVAEIFTKSKELVGDFPILAKMNGYDGRKGGMRIPESIQVAKLLESCGCAAIEVSCGVHEDGLFTVRGDLPVEAAFRYNYPYKSYSFLIKWMARMTAPFIAKKIVPLDNYNVEAASAIKKNVKIPVIVVGGIKSLDSIKTILSEGKSDFISMSRPFIIEPNIVKKFRQGLQNESKCIACNFCVVASEEKPLKCYHGKLNQV